MPDCTALVLIKFLGSLSGLFTFHHRARAALVEAHPSSVRSYILRPQVLASPPHPDCFVQLRDACVLHTDSVTMADTAEHASNTLLQDGGQAVPGTDSAQDLGRDICDHASTSQDTADLLPGVLQIDPWLSPFQDVLKRRVSRAKEWIKKIDETEGGLTKFTKASCFQTPRTRHSRGNIFILTALL